MENDPNPNRQRVHIPATSACSSLYNLGTINLVKCHVSNVHLMRFFDAKPHIAILILSGSVPGASHNSVAVLQTSASSAQFSAIAT